MQSVEGVAEMVGGMLYETEEEADAAAM